MDIKGSFRKLLRDVGDLWIGPDAIYPLKALNLKFNPILVK
jgi:hypothetical protein